MSLSNTQKNQSVPPIAAPAHARIAPFSPAEIEAMQTNPAAINDMADYHDLQLTMYEAMEADLHGNDDFGRHHRKRRAEMRGAACAMTPVVFTAEEVKALGERPEGLRQLAGWHEHENAVARFRGAEHTEGRQDELLAEAQRLEDQALS